MVLNPKSLHVSPQYHVIFHETFSTVGHMDAGTIPENWAKLVKENEDFITEDETQLAKLWSISYYQVDEDPDDVDENIDSNISTHNINPQNELLMPTMPDLEELTNRRSTRYRTAPDRFDPSAHLTSTSSQNEDVYHKT